MANARVDVQVDDKGPKKLGKSLNDAFNAASKGSKKLVNDTKLATTSIKTLVKAQGALVNGGRDVAKLADFYKEIAKNARSARIEVEKLAEAQKKAGSGRGAGAAAGAAAGGAAGAAAGGRSRGTPDPAKEAEKAQREAQREAKRESQRTAREEQQRKREADTKEKSESGKMAALVARTMVLHQLANPGDPMAPFGAMGSQLSTLSHVAGSSGIPIIGPMAGAGLAYLAGGMNTRQQRVSRFMSYNGAERANFGHYQGIGAGSGAEYGLSSEEALSTAAGFTRASGGNVRFGQPALDLTAMGLGPSAAASGGLLGGGGIGAQGRGGKMALSNQERQQYVTQVVGVANEMARRESNVFGGDVGPGKVEEHLQRIVNYTKTLTDQGKDNMDPFKVAGMLAGLQSIGGQTLGAGVNPNTFAGDRGMNALQSMRGSTGSGGSGRFVGMQAALGRGENFWEARASADVGDFSPAELATKFQGIYGRGAPGERRTWRDDYASRMFGLNPSQGAGVARGDFSGGFGALGGDVSLPKFKSASAGLLGLDAKAIESGRGEIGNAAKIGQTLFDMQTQAMNASRIMIPMLQGMNTTLLGATKAIEKLLDWLKAAM